MVFKADELWWQPHVKAYEAVAAGSQRQLEKQQSWLVGLLAKFRPQAEASRAAIEKETHLEAGGRKAAVEDKLRAAALQVSKHLSLDEVQSFFLFKRWVKDEGLSPAPTSLDATELFKVAEYYFMERLHLLKTLEELLLQADADDAAGAFFKKLLDQGLEANLVSQLEAHFVDSGSGNVLPGALPAASGASNAPTGSAAKGSLLAEEQKLWSLQAASERCLLLNLSILLYHHQPTLCTAARWSKLADLLRGTIGGAVIELDPEVAIFNRRACQLATILLVKGLDLEGLLDSVANIDSELEHHLVAPEDSRVLEEAAQGLMASRCPSPIVLLAWSGFQVLQSSVRFNVDDEAEAHARAFGEFAWTNGCLAAMGDMLQGSGIGLDHGLSSLYQTTLLHLLSTVIAAFNISPQTLGPAELEEVTNVLQGLLRDQSDLCEAFWEQQDTEDESEAQTGALAPLASFLNSARDIFPASPLPLLKTLSAFAQGSAASVHAYLYLKSLPALTMLHDVGVMDAVTRHGHDTGKTVITKSQLQLPWDIFTLPEGVEGRIMELPPVLGPDSPLLVPLGCPLGVGRILIRWEGSSPGQMVLVLLAQQALVCLAKGGDYAQPSSSASKLLSAALDLLACLLEAEPGVARDCLAWSWMSESGATHPQADILQLLQAASQTLLAVPQPSADDVGNCFRIGTALAAHVPSQVINCLQAGTLLGRHDQPLGSSAEQAGLPMLLLFQQRVEAPMGRYPATTAFVRLLEALAAAGSYQEELLDWMSHLLHSVLAQHATWQYAQQGDRWRLAQACLQAIRCTLQITQVEGSGCQLRDMVCHAFGQEGAFYGYLLHSIPLGAAVLERMARAGAHSEAAEEAVTELLQLVPPLLTALDAPEGGSRMGKEMFEVPGGTGPMPATLLSSFLGYTAAPQSLMLACLKAIHALGGCAALIDGHVSFAGGLHKGSSSGVSILRGALMGYFTLDTAMAAPNLFCAVASILQVAAEHHASLLDMLMFPSGLSADEPTKESKDPPRSCLDNLWELLQKSEELMRNSPSAAVSVVGLVGTLWQSTERSRKVVGILRKQQGFWEALSKFIPEDPAELDDSVEDLDPEDLDAVMTWRLEAEAKALEIMAWELHSVPGAAKGPLQSDVLSSWSGQAKAGSREHIMMVAEHCCRYCPSSTGALLAKVTRLARVAAVELLGHVYSMPPQACWTGPPLLERLLDDTLWLKEMVINHTLTADDLFQLSADMAVQHAPLQAPKSDDRQAQIHWEAQSWPDSLQQAILSAAQVKVDPSPSPMAEFISQGRLYTGWWQKPGSAPRLAPQMLDVSALEGALGPQLVREFGSVRALLSAARAAEAAAAQAEAALSALRSAECLAVVSCREAMSSSATPEDGLVSASGIEGYCSLLQEAITPLVNDSSRTSLGSREGSAGLSERLAEDLACDFCSSLAEMLLLSVRLASRQKPLAGNDPDMELLMPCNEITNLMASWLRSPFHKPLPGGPGAKDSSQKLLTESLLGSTLGILQLAQPEAGSGTPLQLEAQGSGRTLLPLLASVPRHWPSLAPAAMAAIEVLVHGHLAYREWLPVVQHVAPELLEPLIGTPQRLPPQLLAAADANSAGPGACLQLARGLAQTKQGAELLHQQGVMERCVIAATWLLGPDGGALGVASDTAMAEPNQVDAVDYLMAYAGGRESPVFRQWISLLSLQGSMLYHLAPLAVPEVDSAAVTFVIRAETRLLAALEPPTGLASQPLTLAGVREASSASFLLSQMAPLLAPWQLAVQMSPGRFRCAAVAFLEFAVSGFAGTGYVSCGPQTQEERVMCTGQSSLPADAGWLQILAKATSSVGQGSQGGVTGGSVKRDSSLLQLTCNVVSEKASRYAAEVAVGMYRIVEHCLSFLSKISSGVAPGEAEQLGSGWPSASLLVSLGDHLVDVARSIMHESSAEAQRLRRLMDRCLRSCLYMQGLVGVDNAMEWDSIREILTELTASRTSN